MEPYEKPLIILIIHLFTLILMLYMHKLNVKKQFKEFRPADLWLDS